MSIPVDVMKLKAHLYNVHSIGFKRQHSNLSFDAQGWYIGCENSSIIHRFQKIRPKTYWTKEYVFEDECHNLDKIASPTLCFDSSGCEFHFLLRWLSMLLFLEKYENLTKRREMKRVDCDSRIVTFDFWYAYGQLGRLVCLF